MCTQVSSSSRFVLLAIGSLLAAFLAAPSVQSVADNSTNGDDGQQFDLLRTVKLAERFVAEHPQYEHLLDKIRAGDEEARKTYERHSLSIMLNELKSKLNDSSMADETLVIKFLDEYLMHVTELDDDDGGSINKNKPYMKMEEFMTMLPMDDTVRAMLVELGESVALAECDYGCLGDKLSQVMGAMLAKLMQQQMPEFADFEAMSMGRSGGDNTTYDKYEGMVPLDDYDFEASGDEDYHDFDDVNDDTVDANDHDDNDSGGASSNNEAQDPTTATTSPTSTTSTLNSAESGEL